MGLHRASRRPLRAAMVIVLTILILHQILALDVALPLNESLPTAPDSLLAEATTDATENATPVPAPATPALTPPLPLPSALTPSRPTTPTPTTSTSTSTSTPTPAPSLTNDMRTILRKIGSLPCVEDTRSRMFALLYDANVGLHDTCMADSKYQFFPYTGILPTTTQIVATVQSTACMRLFAGAILAAFPECDIDFVSIRSSAEVFYRIKRDVDVGRVPPTQAQFYELYNLNRVMNLVSENASLIDDLFRDHPTAAAVSLSEMTRVMNPIELLPGVTLGKNMVIKFDDANATAASITEAVSTDNSFSGSGTSLRRDPQAAATPVTPRANSTNLTSSAWALGYKRAWGWNCGSVAVAVAVVLALMVEL